MPKLVLIINLLFFNLLIFFSLSNHTEMGEITMCYQPKTPKFIYSNNTKTLSSIPFQTDPNKSYSMPMLSKNSKGEVMLTWTEKDSQGISSLCVSFSNDNGKTFGEKKTVFTSSGINNSRMMRAKVLSKKDGSLVAVFSLRADAPQNQPQQGRGGGRTANIVYSVSKDGGNTWTPPANVDSDPKQGIMRGFFDAVVLSNDEIAVAYLKDVANSTKHEERDLRLVVSKNGIMQPEKLIDPVVCDCCPIGLLVDKKGNLNVFYRDNNDDIRDIARMVSADNGETFSKPTILHDDKWEIKGCPHSGASAVSTQNEQYVTWFSGTSNTQSGIRLANSEGKLLKVLDASAKNASLASDDKQAILTWEQTAENGANSIFYSKIKDNKVSDNQQIKESINGQNAYSLILGSQTIIAYESVRADKKSDLKVSLID